MEREKISDYAIVIDNPSQLVLSIDEFLHLAKKLPSQHESLKRREQYIFSQLGERYIAQYNRMVIFLIDLDKIVDKVNDKYKDGIALEDNNDMVVFPYSRTIRRKNNVPEAPLLEKSLSLDKISSIKVYHPHTLEKNIPSINENGSIFFIFSDIYDETSKKR